MSAGTIGAIRASLKLVVLLFACWIAWVSSCALIDPDQQSRVLRKMLEAMPWAGYSHVIFGSLALVLGGLQLSSRMRRFSLKSHMMIGNAYVVSVLISTSGSIGHLLVTPLPFALSAGFWLLAIMWPITTLAGYPRGGKFNFQRHGKLMVYSYAMTCAAITLRLWLMVLLPLGVSFSIAYPIAAWAGGVGNLIIAAVVLRILERRRQTCPENTGTAVM